MSNYTLLFGTYYFTNRTFEIAGHQQPFDTPSIDIRRKDGGVSLDANEAPRKIRINGTLYSTDKDTLHNDLNTMIRAVRNSGKEAEFKYRADRYITAQISKEGINAKFEKGLYEYLYRVDMVLVAAKPYAESTTLRTVSGLIYDGVTTDVLTNNGYLSTRPKFTFIAGASFTNDLRVEIPGNSHYFNFTGPLLNGQTLTIDCDKGSVYTHIGSDASVDAISHFGGNLFMELPEGGASNIVINAGTLSYSIESRDRYHI